ncbi:MAG: hypothetical protein CVU36_23925 [Betaproteobacteria bacterium HGW-Betaproteobacteria-9]|jgi:hypothetical protein|nr:MAG: hypothetical protein CVU36_23925 [Betaproteobacteria bacterium HGW-Betaproteobacteria-9]
MHTSQLSLPSTLRLSRRPYPAASARTAADTWVLPRGALQCITRPRGCRIECIAGRAWITHDRDPRDIVLEAGESHICDRPERVIVQALEALTLRVLPPAG